MIEYQQESDLIMTDLNRAHKRKAIDLGYITSSKMLRQLRPNKNQNLAKSFRVRRPIYPCNVPCDF